VRLLLDTHLLLWAAASSKRLSREARDLIEDEANEVHFSAASMWEIAIKSALGRSDFRVDVAAIADALPAMGLAELPVTATHAVAVTRLPAVHRDPFDRLLIAQSIAEPLVLVTNDAVLARYSESVRVV
jgi:PIN domain nuclease of toxin-antitoxin system